MRSIFAPRRSPPSPRDLHRLGLAIGLLALAALPTRAAFTAVPATDGEVVAYLPFVATVDEGGPTPPPVLDKILYLPLMGIARELPLDIIVNPSFENESWFTDSGGNQHPSGWTFYSPANGQTMPFPTKQQGGSTVPALSGGQGEYVHKYYWQLPDNERLGGSRALILNGQLTYKVFSDHIPHALRLSQSLSYTPGRTVRVTGYILGETQAFACSGSGVLEADHFVASVQLGAVADTRFYSVMRSQQALPGNERAWNKFSVTTQVPANGQLALVVIMQSNWGCPVDFFIDHFQAHELTP